MPKKDKDTVATASGSDGSVSDHKDDQKPAAAASSSKAKVKDEDDDEPTPMRKRKATVSEINEDLLGDDDKLKLEQRRAYNRQCAAKVSQCHNLSSFPFPICLELDALLTLLPVMVVIVVLFPTRNIKARKRSKDLISTLQEQVESLTRDKAQLERTNDVMRAQLDLLEQQNRSIMQQQRAIPMHHMQPQMMPHPQHPMGMMQTSQGQPIYTYATAQPGHYIEVQQQQQPGGPVMGMPPGSMTHVHGGGRPGYPVVGLGPGMVQQQGQSASGTQQAPQASSPGGSTGTGGAPAAGSGSMDSNPKYFLS
jgi:hypothetical protein